MSPRQWRTTETVGLIMKTSDNGDSILARIAKRNSGESVKFQDLSEWLSSGECRRSVMEAAAWSMLELSTNDDDWANYTVLSEPQEVDQPTKVRGKQKSSNKASARLTKGSLLPLKGPETRAQVVLDASKDQAIARFTGSMVSPQGQFIENESCSIALGVSEMLELWNNLPLG